MPEESNCSPYILVADDYSTEARTAAEAALQIARIQHLEIQGLYVVDEVLALDTYGNYHAELPLLPRKPNGEQREPTSRAELMSWLETHGRVALNWLQAACTEAPAGRRDPGNGYPQGFPGSNAGPWPPREFPPG